MNNNEFAGYAERIAKIRQLSSPRLDDISSAEDYAGVLRDNFCRIGDLAAENRDFLDHFLFPLLNKSDLLTDEEIQQLYDFTEFLVDPVTVEFLDISIMSMITDRLMEDAERKDDVDYTIKVLDYEVTSNYTMMNLTRRLDAVSNLTEQYRKKGFTAGTKLLLYLQKDAFEKLSEESKNIVLTNSRYISALYEGMKPSPELNHRNITVLLRAISLSEDEFYKKSAPGYDWRYHTFRALEYLCSATENMNLRDLSKEQLEIVLEHSQMLYDIWHSDPEYYDTLCREAQLDMIFARNRFLAGKMDLADYRKELLRIYESRDKYDIGYDSILINVLVPAEYIRTIDKDTISEEQKAILLDFYQETINYTFRVQNNTSVGYMLEYLSIMLLSFVEIPGGMTFENMCISCMAAMHPPTYVHSNMVANFTRCMTSHLLRHHPEYFIGLMGIMNSTVAYEKRDDIVDFAYHCGLCHDFGKLMLLDTIFTYGRKLFDFEFDVIRIHPNMGAWLLSHSALSKRYAQAARGHHRWFDESRGYPYDYQRIGQREQIIIDILTVADCLDAATDVVGRSYNRGKSFEEFKKELIEGSGTQFNPVIVDLFKEEDFIEDIKYLLAKGRDTLYKNTYKMLTEVERNAR